MDISILLKILETGSAPAMLVGGVVFLFFYLKKNEAELRAELSSSLKRLQEEKAGLYKRIEELDTEAEERESVIDHLRRELRAAEDDAHFHRRRADRAEAQLVKDEITYPQKPCG